MKLKLFFAAFFLLPLCMGCSQYVGVSGKITYEDGTPLPGGEVCFTDDKFAGLAAVQHDGTYRMGRNKDGDGIPKGDYKVYLSSGVVYGESPTEGGPPTSTLLVKQKFLSPDTSGLTCTVSGKTVYNFEVEKP